VLGFIAPPLAVVFLLTVYWKRTTRKAVNVVLSVGSAFSLGTGIVYLWVLPPDRYSFWPHYLMLSFYIFVFLAISAILISLLDKNPVVYQANSSETDVTAKPSRRVKIAWLLLAVVMVILYFIFNGH
jgi:SSS family solute:Na+ symporter